MSDKLEIVTVSKNLYYHEVAYVRGLERERDELREALTHIAEHLGSMTVAAKSSHVCQARDIARAALEGKP